MKEFYYIDMVYEKLSNEEIKKIKSDNTYHPS